MDPVRPAAAAELSRIGAVLARAFQEDPAASWVLPDPEVRRRRNPRLFATNVRNSRDKGEVWTTDDLRGAALWSAPGRWKDRPRHMLRWFPAFLTVWQAAPRAVRIMRLMERHHPRADHWYLDVLGVEPDRQGQGAGTALMRPVLDRCDAESTPAYLVSSNIRNLPLYERHGFEVIEKLPVPGGPILYPMWRDPRRPGRSGR